MVPAIYRGKVDMGADADSTDARGRAKISRKNLALSMAAQAQYATVDGIIAGPSLENQVYYNNVKLFLLNLFAYGGPVV